MSHRITEKAMIGNTHKIALKQAIEQHLTRTTTQAQVEGVAACKGSAQ